MRDRIKHAKRPIRVLDLFGYTAIAGLAAAEAGANVTYVDASKPTMAWARENQNASGLDDKPIRWILDDALKFVRREARRDSRYDGIIVDPPAFGRGPKGEIWRFHTSFPQLMEACRDVLSDKPLFFIINAYAIELSSIALYDILAESVAATHGGSITVGDLALNQTTPGAGGLARLLPAGLFGRWSNEVEP
jgi:23S rRNA (cytosine1962-C5)-methyltransferase